MKNPDFVLSKIHRQAEKSGIVRFATDIRLDNPIKNSYEDIEFKKNYKKTFD